HAWSELRTIGIGSQPRPDVQLRLRYPKPLDEGSVSGQSGWTTDFRRLGNVRPLELQRRLAIDTILFTHERERHCSEQADYRQRGFLAARRVDLRSEQD